MCVVLGFVIALVSIGAPVFELRGSILEYSGHHFGTLATPLAPFSLLGAATENQDLIYSHFFLTLAALWPPREAQERPGQLQVIKIAAQRSPKTTKRHPKRRRKSSKT